MSDIFLSYASPDQPRAKLLAHTLEARGWTVWWDRHIPAGQSFEEVIEEELAQASCVLVLWSAASVKSDWVKEEATEAARRKVLIPVLIEQVTIPLGFRRIQAAPLTDWQEAAPHPGFEQLVRDIAALIGPPRHALPETSAQTAPSTGANRVELMHTGKRSRALRVFMDGQVHTIKFEFHYYALVDQLFHLWLNDKKVFEGDMKETKATEVYHIEFSIPCVAGMCPAKVEWRLGSHPQHIKAFRLDVCGKAVYNEGS